MDRMEVDGRFEDNLKGSERKAAGKGFADGPFFLSPDCKEVCNG